MTRGIKQLKVDVEALKRDGEVLDGYQAALKGDVKTLKDHGNVLKGWQRDNKWWQEMWREAIKGVGMC